MSPEEVIRAISAAVSERALLAAGQLIQHIEPISARMRVEAVFAKKYQAMKGKRRHV